MNITWHGQTCLKITTKGKTIVLDPYSNEKAKGFTGKADISLLSTLDESVGLVSGKDAGFVIDGPGEYEVGGTMITGVASRSGLTEEENIANTIYTLYSEGISVCHLGFLGEKLTDEQLEKIGSIDVLLLPVSGVQSFGVVDALKVMNAIEPSVVIPVLMQHDKISVEHSSVETFCKEFGCDAAESQDKALIKQADLTGEDVHAILLKPQV